MKCKHCGNEIEENAAFCPSCGRAQIGEGEISTTPTVPQPKAPEAVKPKGEEGRGLNPIKHKKGEVKRAKRKRAEKKEEADCNPPALGELLKKPLNVLYLVLAAICMVPNLLAEYRRIANGVSPDGIYWLLVSPTLIALGLLFLAFGMPYIRAAKARAKKEYEESGAVKTPVWETVNKVLVVLFLVIAAVCFLISMLVRVIG